MQARPPIISLTNPLNPQPTATFFAEFLIVASALHAAHWLQRFIFYRFQARWGIESQTS